MVALLGFYAALTVVLAGHLGGGGYGHEFMVETRANRIYFLAGLLTGPLFGAAGAWIGRRHPNAIWLIVGGLMTGEIIGVAFLQGHQIVRPPLYFAWGVSDWTPYVAQSLLGTGIMVVAFWRRRSRQPAA